MYLSRRIYISVVLGLILATSAGVAADEQGTVGGKNATGREFITDIFSYADGHRPSVDLNGRWEFRRDADNQGTKLLWHEGRDVFHQTISVPGAPQAQGIGEPNQRQKSFFLEPFWARRHFIMPILQADERAWLRIGGILPAAEIYLNGRLIGYTKSSRTQQRVDVTDFLESGKENLIAIKVCDFPKVRLDGLWEMTECCKIWTGIYRPMALEITHRVSIIDAYIQPRLASGTIEVDIALSEPIAEAGKLLFIIRDGTRIIGSTTASLAAEGRGATATVKLDSFTPWAPENPHLYTLEIALNAEGRSQPLDQVSIRFGMREIKTEGTKFYLNGRPIFVRAFGDDQYYPETLCLPADKNWYLSRLKRARAFGMNASKSCVETLPQEYIEAADEAGIMIIQETPFGLSDLRANRYTIDQEFRDYYARELDGLVRQSRNHASVIAYSMSSEMEFSNQTQESFDFFSRDLVRQTRELAPHALVIDCTGYLNAEETAKGKRDTDFYASIIPTWMKEVLDETSILTDRRHPTILHEYNWWSCYPDPADKVKYADTQIKPFWLDQLVETARKNGQEDMISMYRKNSLWLQALCRKDGIEYARRNPDVEGYILWLLIDFGQYAEGLLDDFWQPKNVSAEEFLKSNGDTVILLAEEGNRCLKMGDSVRIPLAVSHYGAENLGSCTLLWNVKGGNLDRHGQLDVSGIEPGKLTSAGVAEFDLPSMGRAFKMDLSVELRAGGKTINNNEWSFWAFSEPRSDWTGVFADVPNEGRSAFGAWIHPGPKSKPEIPSTASLVIADYADESLTRYLEQGGRCLLLTHGAAIENTAVYFGTMSFYRAFRTIPWNAGNSGNSGSVIADHPALADFPHEGLCDLQFVWMIRDVLPMEFSDLRPYGVQPILRMIDHYAANRNNAHLLEFKVGQGRVLACSLNLRARLPKHIEARVLLDNLVRYTQGDQFQPTANVPSDVFLKLFRPRQDEAAEKPGGPNELLK